MSSLQENTIEKLPSTCDIQSSFWKLSKCFQRVIELIKCYRKNFQTIELPKITNILQKIIKTSKILPKLSKLLKSPKDGYILPKSHRNRGKQSCNYVGCSDKPIPWAKPNCNFMGCSDEPILWAKSSCNSMGNLDELNSWVKPSFNPNVMFKRTNLLGQTKLQT